MLKLKEFRLQQGIDQKQLANEIHIGKGSISNWEVGRTEPSLEYIEKLANYFGCTIDALFGRKNYATGNVEIVGVQLTSDEQQLVNLYRTLPTRARAELVGFAKGLAC